MGGWDTCSASSRALSRVGSGRWVQRERRGREDAEEDGDERSLLAGGALAAGRLLPDFDCTFAYVTFISCGRLLVGDFAYSLVLSSQHGS